MKQYITIEQLNELSDKGKEKLRNWWEPKEGDKILIPKGVRYGDGYGGWAKKLTEEDVVHFVGDISIGYGSASKRAYGGDIRFESFQESEYGDDNDFQYPISSCYPLLSIGQMIEFLDANAENGVEALAIDKGEYEWYVYYVEKPKHYTSVELVNALWEAVKEILEK